MKTLYLPAPPVVDDPALRCPACQGRGVTGDQFTMAASEAVEILVDVLCAVCGGCGRGRHTACSPMQHIDWDVDDELAELHQQPRCPSCHGRQWNLIQAFTQPDDPDETDEVYLRVPCGCAEPAMVEIAFVEDDLPAEVMAALTGAVAVTQLVTVVRAAADAAAEQAPPGADVGSLMRTMMSDPDLMAAWRGAGDVARTVAIVAYAQHAAETPGVDLDGDGQHYEIAEGAVEMAAEDLAQHPGRSLVPDQPGVMPGGRVGAFVSSWVCDSTEPDVNKLRALCLLAAAAPTSRSPR
ncbi:hypothetical protein [Catellatospora sp. NPDC049609]|uniref:hypothetical protein n=1 Tax=Catellatospora sp. NPDC049609 TaxID=3155505 RepID=UPI0034193DF4